jgi:D-glycero-D-manno-heptose 1,7-bisphosphate phosphatase
VSKRPAVFIDRDGTLIEERHYPTRAEDIVPVDGAGQCLHKLSTAGFARILLTNQSAVARGMLVEEELEDLHRHLLRQLAPGGGDLDGIYYCPHHPEGVAVGYNFVCGCRKPARGLLDMALAEHDIDLPASIFIGDSPRDLFPHAGPVAARILVRSGHPLDDTSMADYVADDLVDATRWILDHFAPEAETVAEAVADPVADTVADTVAEAETTGDVKTGSVDVSEPGAGRAPDGPSIEGTDGPDEAAPSGDEPHE